MRFLPRPGALLPFLILAAALPAQTLRYVSDGAGAGFSKGWALARTGDVNADGVPDLAVGCTDTFVGPGTVQVVSLADGTVIRTLTGEAVGNTFGSAVDAGFDVDGDGVGDVISGAPGFDVGNPFDNRGRAYVHSGATGNLLFTVTGGNAFDAFGSSVALLGDVDGDGRSEFAVGAPGATGSAGQVTVFRGINGVAFWARTGDVAGDRFGASVAAAGDITGDGVPDLLVGAPYKTVGGLAGAGRIHLFSGATGLLVRAFDATQAAEHLGVAVASVPDLDADGVRDVVGGAPDHDGPWLIDSGRARAWSGATGTLLWEVAGALVYLKAGLDVDPAGDLDGDGTGDVLVGMPYIPP